LANPAITEVRHHADNLGVRLGIWPRTLTYTVAVGTAVAHCPPHRPVLARLTHTVPTLDRWRQSACWDKDAELGRQESGHRVALQIAPMSNGSAGCAAEAGASIIAARRAETPVGVPRCPEQHGIESTPLPEIAATLWYPRESGAFAVAASL